MRGPWFYRPKTAYLWWIRQTRHTRRAATNVSLPKQQQRSRDGAQDHHAPGFVVHRVMPHKAAMSSFRPDAGLFFKGPWFDVSSLLALGRYISPILLPDTDTGRAPFQECPAGSLR